ncbi:MAG TPA: hypothetical protein VGN34_13450 [Ktedonobacteraceae bacterium]
MLEPNCDLLLPVIDQLTQEISAVDDQINALGVEELKELNLWRYFKLQRKVDHLIKEQHTLQAKWNKAMYELAICRSTHPYNGE